MNRYGIETIAESVYQSSICPFMRERGCANGNEDCQKCVKEWFTDHDKQIRDEVVDCVTEKYFDVIETVLHDKNLGLELNQALSIYARIMNSCNEVAEQMKGEQNNGNSE